jgi:hypothetical protein
MLSESKVWCGTVGNVSNEPFPQKILLPIITGIATAFGIAAAP